MNEWPWFHSLKHKRLTCNFFIQDFGVKDKTISKQHKTCIFIDQGKRNPLLNHCKTWSEFVFFFPMALERFCINLNKRNWTKKEEEILLKVVIKIHTIHHKW